MDSLQGARSIKAGRLLVASAGNQVMQEIARVFVDGFIAAGLPTELRVDELPSLEAGPDLLQIIVAPHEYFPLFAELRYPPSRCRAANRSAYLLNVEQPGTPWFELAFRHHRRARGWLDIHRSGVEQLALRGAAAIHAPLGCPTWFADQRAPIERCVDYFFIGSWSPRREQFLAAAAPELALRRSRVHLLRLGAPRLATTPGVLVGEALARALASSRVVLCVRGFPNPYFEWHRALRAIANGCVVVSESGTGHEPLVPGEHLVTSDLEHLLAAAKELLDNEPRRREMSEAARSIVRERLDPGRLAADLLERLDVQPRAAEARVRERGRRVTRVRWWGALVKAYVRSTPRRWQDLLARLRSPSRLAIRLHEWWRRDASKVDPHAIAEAARIARRERSDALRAGGIAPWSSTANSLWSEGAAAEVAVVITLYNYERWVVDCLESVWSARIDGHAGGIEIVLVDDASTNRAPEVARELLARSPSPMLLVEKSLNTGVADARNVGLELARAPFVFTLDADNLLFPTALARLAATARERRLSAVYGLLQVMDEDGHPLGLASCYPWDERELVRRPYIDAMALFDRAALLELGGYSADALWQGWEDYDLWLKLASAARPSALLPEFVGAYRLHPQSMIRETNRHTLDLARHLREKFRDLAVRHADLAEQFAYPRGI